MTRLYFDPDVPELVRGLVEPLLRKHLHRCPSWCAELLIGWDPASNGAELRVVGHAEYRWARIVVHSPFLDAGTTPNKHEDAMLHEIIHLHLEAMHQTFHDLVEAAIGDDNPKLRLWAEQSWRRSWEGAVCDLTAMQLNGLDRNGATNA